jgi:hypothetical protein
MNEEHVGWGRFEWYFLGSVILFSIIAVGWAVAAVNAIDRPEPTSSAEITCTNFNNVIFNKKDTKSWNMSKGMREELPFYVFTQDNKAYVVAGDGITCSQVTFGIYEE